MTSILDTLLVTPPEVTVDEIKEIALLHFGLKGNVKNLGGERDRNFLIENDESILLKVGNPGESDELLDMQCAALKHIEQTDPTLPVPKLIPTKDGKQWATSELANGVSVRVRAFTFLQGKSVGDVLEDSGLMKNLGRTVAGMDIALRGFFHASAKHPLAWDLHEIHQLEGLVKHINEPEEKALVEQTLENFKENIKPILGSLRSQVIHNDVSFHNTVVDPNNPSEITGIFDFGDMLYAPLIQNLAVLAAEVASSCKDPVARSAEIVAGYHEVLPLEEKEFEILPAFISARLALVSLICSWQDAETDWTDDREFMGEWENDCYDFLKIISKPETLELENIFRSACGKPITVQHPQSNGNAEKAIKQRNHFLGNASYIAYDSPIYLTHGEGVWLWDSNGNKLLDVYNNVPHAGHCHPRITAAIAKQTSLLNTNTRYLYDVVTAYAEKLTATLPDELEVCYFVSSGSEANDLAWRLATICTGNTGGLVLENAYHGITEAIYALSPEEMRGPNPNKHVVEIDAPDDYRGPWKRDDPDRGSHYAEYAKKAIEHLKGNGHKPAAFFMDTTLNAVADQNTFGMRL
ncbi:MAG: aminotransferase class III-fold pyridoxal phosphate-dependent enzyme, partial [Bacteroidetes bacterium]|nr:aminotransferase class III-fold pyridoxal phosphate-dependent enzyme [Bacteroidota bacterium]